MDLACNTKTKSRYDEHFGKLRRPFSQQSKSRSVSIPEPVSFSLYRLTAVMEDLEKLDADVDYDCKLFTTAEKIKLLCTGEQEVEQVVDLICQYSLKNKQNAHFGALLCNYLKDLKVGEAKFGFLLLSRIQQDYEDRDAVKKQLGRFLMNVTFMCEIFNHVRLGADQRIRCSGLVPALDCYFSMLLKGGSEKEMEVLAEQLPKCYAHIKNNYANQFQDLISAMKKLIISKSSTEATRSLVLQTFEMLLTDCSLCEKARSLYRLYKTTSSICK